MFIASDYTQNQYIIIITMPTPKKVKLNISITTFNNTLVIILYPNWWETMVHTQLINIPRYYSIDIHKKFFTRLLYIVIDNVQCGTGPTGSLFVRNEKQNLFPSFVSLFGTPKWESA